VRIRHLAQNYMCGLKGVVRELSD